MPLDRSIRFLSALGGASTSRVLNLSRIAADNADNPDHARRPLFLSPVINRGFLVKHRVRSDEAYLFNAPRTVATKLILPFDHGDLRAGGRSLFVDQRGFEEALCSTGNYKPRALDRDLGVIRLVAAVPSLDPFLLREHLRNNGIDVAPCYFTISPGDQERMHDFVSREVSQLIELAGGNGEHDIGRMVSALLSTEITDRLAPLRATLDLTGEDFREGVFSWRGFLYYKWSMQRFWPDVLDVLREISCLQPFGAVDADQTAFLTRTRHDIIRMVRESGGHVTRALSVYDSSFADLVAHQSPRTFRDFLLSAPFMFL